MRISSALKLVRLWRKEVEFRLLVAALLLHLFAPAQLPSKETAPEWLVSNDMKSSKVIGLQSLADKLFISSWIESGYLTPVNNSNVFFLPDTFDHIFAIVSNKYQIFFSWSAKCPHK